MNCLLTPKAHAHTHSNTVTTHTSFYESARRNQRVDQRRRLGAEHHHAYLARHARRLLETQVIVVVHGQLGHQRQTVRAQKALERVAVAVSEIAACDWYLFGLVQHERKQCKGLRLNSTGNMGSLMVGATKIAMDAHKCLIACIFDFSCMLTIMRARERGRNTYPPTRERSARFCPLSAR